MVSHPFDLRPCRVSSSSCGRLEYDSRQEAAAAGRQLAREARIAHIVRNIDGTVAEGEYYGDDSHDQTGQQV